MFRKLQEFPHSRTRTKPKQKQPANQQKTTQPQRPKKQNKAILLERREKVKQKRGKVNQGKVKRNPRKDEEGKH